MDKNSSTRHILDSLNCIKQDIDQMLCSSQLNQWDEVERYLGDVEEQLAKLPPELTRGYEDELRYIYANLTPIINVTKVHQEMIVGELRNVQNGKNTDRYFNSIY